MNPRSPPNSIIPESRRRIRKAEILSDCFLKDPNTYPCSIGPRSMAFKGSQSSAYLIAKAFDLTGGLSFVGVCN